MNIQVRDHRNCGVEMATKAVLRWTDAFMYDRICAKDRDYDGRFLTGVLTTGIYCLPSCPARKPKLENVRFFKSEAEAIAFGLRPCRRCRPELYYRGEDWDRSLFDGLLTRLRADPADFPDIGNLAKTAGISATKLNDLVRDHAHLTPAALLRRERISAICRQLLETDKRVVDIALAAGFDGEATLHRHFRTATGLTPSAYRALRDRPAFVLELPRGYRATDALAYHGRDPAGPAERLTAGNRFSKALVVEETPVILHIAFVGTTAQCHVESARRLSATAIASVHRTVIRMLGLSTDAGGFESRAIHDPAIARLIQGRRGMRVPLATSSFEALAWAIIGQQINLGFATALRRALIELAGHPIGNGTDMRAHPSAAEVAQLDPQDLTRLRFSRSKAEYLIDMARLAASGQLPLEELEAGSAKRAEAVLLGIRGLGPWTANYTMMRGFGFADAVPVGDVVLSNGLQRFHLLENRPDAQGTATLMAPFAPHRSLATCHFWASLKDAV